MKRKSILAKTFLNLFCVMILLVVVVHISIFFIYKNFYVNHCIKQMNMDLDYVIEILKNTDNYDEVLTSYTKTNNVNICFKIKNETKYYHGNEFYLDFFSEKDTLVNISGVNGMDAVLFQTQNVKLKDGTNAIVQLSMNLQHLKEARGIAFSLLPYSLIISLVVSILFSYYYSKKITDPILKMSNTVKAMTELERGAAIAISNDDELGVLADHINDLYQNLLKVIDDYKDKNEEVLHLERERLDFFRGASHELKTPLAKLSVLQENMRYNIGKYKDRDKYLDESLVIIQELSQMISDILNGVKNMHAENQNIKMLPLKEHIENVIDDYQLIAKSKHITIHTQITGNMELFISKTDLEKVLSNVISNAVKYSIEGTEVQIELTDTQLTVYNEANPIPEETMQSIWKGAYLLGESHTEESTGLGLYIVKTILEQYKIKYYFVPYKNGYLFKIEK